MKLNLTHILIVVCILNQPVKSDFLGLGGWLGGMIDAAASPLIGTIKQAVLESMDYLFD